MVHEDAIRNCLACFNNHRENLWEKLYNLFKIEHYAMGKVQYLDMFFFTTPKLSFWQLQCDGLRCKVSSAAKQFLAIK